MWDPAKDFRTVTLGNGTNVHWLYVDRPFVHVEFIVHSGAGCDIVPGTAHFVEHMVAHQLEQVGATVKRELLREGADLNLGETSDASTRYGARIPVGWFDRVLAGFGQVLVAPIIDAAHVEHERKVILREYERTARPAAERFIEEIRRSLYPVGHPLHGYFRPAGNRESINQITLDHLNDFLRQHYAGANTSVVVVGGIRNPVPQLARVLRGIPRGARSMVWEGELPRPAVSTFAIPWPTVLVDRPDGVKIDCYFAFPDDDSLLRELAGCVAGTLSDVIRHQMGQSYGFSTSVVSYGCCDEVQINGEVARDARPKFEDIYDDALDRLLHSNGRLERLRERTVARIRMREITVRDVFNIACACVEDGSPIATIESSLHKFQTHTVEDMLRTLRKFDRRNAVIAETFD